MAWQNFLKQLSGLYITNNKGLCFPLLQPCLLFSCPTWDRHIPDRYFLCSCKRSCCTMGQWLHISPAVCCSPWYRLKAIPVYMCRCFAHWQGKVATISSALCCGSFERNLRCAGTALIFSSLTPKRALWCTSSCPIMVFSIVMLL